MEVDRLYIKWALNNTEGEKKRKQQNPKTKKEDKEKGKK